MIKCKLIDANAGKRYLRRNEKGRFEGNVAVGGLVSADCHEEAKDKARACDQPTAAPGFDWP
ncbi:hypothetical protein AM571_PC00469 (plasmid) [Rhizobium etli 8C-3]|uniref:Uncharacterized protein n=2 Tax=Rhizobium TaxID=379 RepID=A0A4R3RII2_9HYPH|nr:MULTISPECIES: hypothetical protein [Rhizobium]APO78207.1 hypothetical protein AM571_PC00469 [Rhizobium etli 8C-3]TCU31166.1 hypothetical protein EV130_101743 [Rhizobium azibense]TCU40821.1 hypothetical protein EV129_101106 [Rhizobium azibense]